MKPSLICRYILVTVCLLASTANAWHNLDLCVRTNPETNSFAPGESIYIYAYPPGHYCDHQNEGCYVNQDIHEWVLIDDPEEYPFTCEDASFYYTFNTIGIKTATLYGECLSGWPGVATLYIPVVEVASLTVEPSQGVISAGQSATITANPNPADKSFSNVFLAWQRCYRESLNDPWGNWYSVQGNPDCRTATLNTSTPGYYQYRARHGSGDPWKYSAEVLVDFDIDLISPGDGHKEVYSSDPNGVLTLNCSASLTCGHTVDPNLISFDCEAIGNSVKDVGPVTFENGIYSCIITFTTLPEEITDFGPKTVSVKYNGVVKDSNQIEVYFPFEATNWPGAVPVQPPPANFPDIRWAEKNWYFYYKQTPVFAGYECAYYPFQSGSHYDPITFPFQPYVGSLKNPHEVKPYTYTYSGTNYYRVDGGHTYWGLDVFSWATKHETRHSKNMQSWWEQSDYDPDDDNDEDFIPDALEPYFLPSEGGPYDPNTNKTHGTDYIHFDPEHELLFTQYPTGDPNSLAHLDWAFPGSRWH